MKIRTAAKPAATSERRVLLPLYLCNLVYSQVLAPTVNKKLTNPGPIG
jgi:hypothetical protein